MKWFDVKWCEIHENRVRATLADHGLPAARVPELVERMNAAIVPRLGPRLQGCPACSFDRPALIDNWTKAMARDACAMVRVPS